MTDSIYEGSIPTVTGTTQAAQTGNLPVSRNIKIGFFHLGSGMADVLVNGVWNRIMISDLGFAAGPISVLGSLRYFLAPVGVWAGRISDERAVGGYRRLFWIWMGRIMMLASVFGLGTVTGQLASGSVADTVTWLVISGLLFLFGLGSAFSGSTFLALVYDRSPEHQRGRAVGIVWTFLLLGYTFGGAFFGIMLPAHENTKLLMYGGPAFAQVAPFARLLVVDNPNVILNLFLVAGMLMGALWFFSLVGEERRARLQLARESGQPAAARSSIRSDLALVWRMPSMRFFAFYLTFSMMFAFSQDFILEPFAGDVFGMSVAVTSRFATYWGSMSILGTLLFLWLSRRHRWLTNANMSYIGVWVLVVAFGVFTVSALLQIRWLVTPGLIVLGIGLGVWNVGTLGLMMDMSPLKRAGTFLGFWTLVVTLARGLGTSGGGIVRDVVMSITQNNAQAYGLTFGLGAVGLLLALWMLLRANVKTYQADGAFQRAEQVFAGGLD